MSARNFTLLQIILCIPSYSVASFFKGYHFSKVKINKMVNEQCLTYRPSPSGFTSRIFLLMCLYTPQCFISQKIFVWNFQSNLYIPLWFSGIPKFVLFQLRENAPVSQRTESRYRQWKQGREGVPKRFHEAKNRFHSSKYSEFPRSYLHFFCFEVLSLLSRHIEIKNLSYLIHKTLVEFGWTHVLQRIFLRSSLWYHIAFSLL